MISVTILPSDTGACGGYRLMMPLLDLKRRGEVDITCRMDKSGVFLLAVEDVERSDVVVIQKQGMKARPPAMVKMLLDLIGKYRSKFVYECDDDLSALGAPNPAWTEELKYNPGFFATCARLMRACGTVTCTTPHLAGVLARQNGNVRVVPNGIPLELWPGKKPAKDDAPGDSQDRPVRVGYLASRNHVEDIAVLVKPWKWLARTFPPERLQFILGGAFYPELKAALGDRLDFFEGVDMEHYPAWAGQLRLDIGVAPLADTVFARSKSPLKMLEYAALGVPCVASYIGPYKDVDCLGGPRPVRNSQDWINALRHLIETPVSRAEVAALQRRVVEERYTLRHTADAWLEVLRDVVAGQPAQQEGAA